VIHAGLAALLLASTAVAAAGPPALDVQGHRGAMGHMPENTLPAFEYAIALGVTTLELDLQVTKDRVLVVHHDQRLDPNRCVRDDGREVRPLPIKDLLYEELADIDCGRRPKSKFPEQRVVDGARIPTFDAVASLARGADYSVRLNVEIKLQKERFGIPLQELASLVVIAIRDHDLVGRTTVQSFRPDALLAIRALEPDLPRAILVRRRKEYVGVMQRSAATVLSPRYDGLKREDVERFRERGIPVIPWTVNEPDDIERMIEWGVDGIISDYPDRVIRIRDRLADLPD
jgi:glycerophosphoryl diester phosphodiesterase